MIIVLLVPTLGRAGGLATSRICACATTPETLLFKFSIKLNNSRRPTGMA
jgi:hypothetical protein